MRGLHTRVDESGCGGVPCIPWRDTRAVASRHIVIGEKAKSGWGRGGTGAAAASRGRGGPDGRGALGLAIH